MDRPRIDQLVDVALQGAGEVMAVYEAGFTVETKADASPVTDADLRAERVIADRLKALAPGVPIVAEEAAAAGAEWPESRRLFLVDPLDGTKEFVRGNGDFTVNIGLVENGVPIAGVVCAPAIGRIWWGAAGDGAMTAELVGGRLADARPIAVRQAPESLVAVASRSHGSEETEAFLEKFPILRRMSRGSSLKFCLLAEGEADLYPRFGRTMEWDTAAGDAVLRAAGGLVTTLGGEPLAYGKRRQADDVDFANPFFVAYGDPALAEGVKQGGA